jgi:hypothetical protein
LSHIALSVFVSYIYIYIYIYNSVTAAGWTRGAGGGVQEIEVKAGNDAPKLVIARGLVSHTAADKAFSTSQWLAMALIILLDVLTLCLATGLFLTPLEKMLSTYNSSSMYI